MVSYSMDNGLTFQVGRHGKESVREITPESLKTDTQFIVNYCCD